MTKIKSEGLVIHHEGCAVKIQLKGPDWIKCSLKNTLENIIRGGIKLPITFTAIAIVMVCPITANVSFPTEQEPLTATILQSHWAVYIPSPAFSAFQASLLSN